MDTTDADSSRSASPESVQGEQDHKDRLRESPITPHRKRARVDDEIEDMLGTSHSAELVRDSTYYMEDGSCVLQVGNTLFNVHKTLLSRDGSLFSDMFAIPQGNLEEDGSSDDNPLVLHGDTVQEFKSFLWSLYALPHELMVIHTANADITHLINIARVSFKYHFGSIETWALDAINEHVNRKDSPLLSILTTNPPTQASLRKISDQISRLMRLAQLCDHERLLLTMTSLLRKLMGLSNSLRYAHLAMSLADELDLRELRGMAYHEVMQKAVVVARPEGYRASTIRDSDEEKDEQFDSKGRLIVTRQQQLRILQGYYRLTCAWEKLRNEPVHFNHAATCNVAWHQNGCTQSWIEFWKEKTKGDSVNQLGLADLVGRLKAISKDFDRWGSATYMHHDCRMLARRAISEKIKQVEAGLPDFFVEEVAF